MNTTISEGKSILQLAVRRFRRHEKITDLIRVILDLGADVNAKDSSRNSTLCNVLLSDLGKFVHEKDILFQSFFRPR